MRRSCSRAASRSCLMQAAPSANLQVRFFPSLTMIAAAMIGIAIADWRPRTVPRALPLAVSGAVVGLALLSVVKATNDPVFSNKWSFLSPE